MANKVSGRYLDPEWPLRFFPWILVIYSTSFFLPVFPDVEYSIDGNSGLMFFVELLLDDEEPAYIAHVPNVALWIGLTALVFRKWLLARICGVVAFLAALLIAITFWTSGFLINFAVGYYAWLCSMALLLIAIILKSR
jgi:hypothetical protein